MKNIKTNVHLVNNLSVEQDSVRLIFSTLWSKISQTNRWQIEQSMSDFRVIKFNDFRFSTDQFNLLHQESLTFITRELHHSYTGKTVVVTHHVPTFMQYPETYRGDVLNEAFAVELYDLIETNGPDFWIFGHHHFNGPDFEIGKTQLSTNQLGYVKYGEHQFFNPSKTISV